MSIGLELKQPRRSRGRRRDRPRSAAPSVREVCLLGLGCCDRPSGWRLGAPVDWQGRTYRIADRDPLHIHFRAIEGSTSSVEGAC